MNRIALENDIAIMRALQCLLRVADNHGYVINAFVAHGVPLNARIEATRAALEAAKNQQDSAAVMSEVERKKIWDGNS